MITEKEYLGTAIKSPVDLVKGSASTVNGRENVKQAIGILLNTPMGHRMLLPEYGCRIEELLFDHE